MARAGSILGSHGDEFDERNLLLWLALGMLAASRRLDAVLAGHVERGCRAPHAPGDEALVDFVLGLIAFRDRVVATLGSARRAAPSAEPPPPVAPDGLLR